MSGQGEGDEVKWFKNLLHFLSGTWVDEIVFNIREQTKVLSENTERLRQRAILDGEERYFEKPPNDSSSN
jgi:hypothetical protein